MKTKIKVFFSILLISSVAVMSSCEKDEGKLPNISFKSGAGYTSDNATVAKNTNVTIGIDASKSEDKDVLKTFNESVSFDGGANSTVLNETLSGSQGDSYSKDVTVTTRNVAGTEKYTFTVTNRDGITNQVSLTLTVQ